MLVFDAVIRNTDRHLGNFGFLVDSHTNKLLQPAPIFDNGLSLYCYALDSDLANIPQQEKTLSPALYAVLMKLPAMSWKQSNERLFGIC